jgi:YHS domain-containing protein
MVRAYLTSAIAGAFLLGMATAALAVKGEFGNMCAASLAGGKETQTDCSINGQYLGKTYCFGSKEAMGLFMQNPKDNLAKAQTYYSSKHPG